MPVKPNDPDATSSGNVIVGTPVTLSTLYAPGGTPTVPDNPPTCQVVDPVGNVTVYAGGQIGNPSTGAYSVSVITTVAGTWHWYWNFAGQQTDQGVFTAETDFAGVSGTTITAADLTDLMVLVPRTRRVCEGPYGAPNGKPPLMDSQLYEMVADACADIILFTGNLFGHRLIVKSRDPLMGFPTGWGTNDELDEWESSLISTQAALNFFIFLLRDLRTGVSIKNEGTEWSYTLSANVLAAYLKELQTRRDLAIAGLRLHHPVLDRYASNIRVRDQATVAILEWWDTNIIDQSGIGMPGGQEASAVPWTPGWTGPGFTM